jgi:flagellar protein FliS
MTTYASTSSSAYRANAVLTASSPQLIVMLYDGARRFLHQASVAMAERQPAVAHGRLRRAEYILRHLRNTLDMDQGEIPANLHAIYEFCLRQCQKARMAQDPEVLDQINAMLGQLRESWATIAEQAQGADAAPVAPAAVAVTAGAAA